MKNIADLPIACREEEFAACLRASDSYTQGIPGRREYIDGSISRLYRFFKNMTLTRLDFAGPTLDVASGRGLLFPALRRFFPALLPYRIAEMKRWELDYDGCHIDGCSFELEKDRLQFEDGAFGVAVFCDILEHLVVDPLWPLFELNRVLRPGGRIIINTPNAMGAFRLLSILNGQNPATESQIKPSSIYQRHNREWTPEELRQGLACCGFGNFYYSTNPAMLGDAERKVLTAADAAGLLKRPAHDFGPELFMVAQKLEHRTLDMELPADLRWPQWLYTGFDAYRKRPRAFPIIVGEDYA